MLRGFLPKLIYLHHMLDCLAQGTETTTTHATCVADSTSMQAKRIIAMTIALAKANLICAELVEFVKIKVPCLISQLQESVKT